MQAAGTSCVEDCIYRAFFTNFNFRTLAYLDTKTFSDNFVNQWRKTTKFHSIFLKTFLEKFLKLSENSLGKFECFNKSYNNKYTQNAWWRLIRVDVLSTFKSSLNEFCNHCDLSFNQSLIYWRVTYRLNREVSKHSS